MRKRKMIKPPRSGEVRALFFVLLLALGIAPPSWAQNQITTSGSETLINESDTSGSQYWPRIATNSNGDHIVVWTTNSNLYDGDGAGITVRGLDASGSTLISQSLVNSNNTTGSQQYADVALNDNGDYVIAWMTTDAEAADVDGFAIRHTAKNLNGTTLTNETVTNTTTVGQQRFPAVSISEIGDYVIVWESDGDIVMQRYANTAAATGSETVVNSTTNSLQTYPDVAMDNIGNFVVVWQSTGQDGDGTGIYGQLYDSAGTTQGDEFSISETTSGDQLEPRVGMDSDGNFIVVWSDSERGNGFDVYAQMYNADGSKNGSNFRVNSTAGNDQMNPDIDVTPKGHFAISWTSWGADDDKTAVIMQVYNSEGEEKGDETQVNTNESNFQTLPAVGFSEHLNNPLYIVWMDGENGADTTQDGSEYGIYLQEFNVDDIENPVVVVNDITVYLDQVGDVQISESDIEAGSSDNIGIVSYSISSKDKYLDCGDVGDNNVTLTVTDSAGNEGAAVAVVTVMDTLGPTVGARDWSVTLDENGDASITVNNISNRTSTDNCGVTLALTQYDFTCDDLGANTIGLVGTDPSGNKDTAWVTVTVLDDIAPALTASADITVYLDSDGNASVTTAALYSSATDNCSVTSLVASDTTFTCDDVGTNAITLIAFDANSNSDTVTVNVTVEDNQNPTAIASTITAYLDDSGNAAVVPSEVGANSTDNCGITNYVLSDTTFSCSDIGANSVLLTVYDAAGYFDTTAATITVVDSIAPTVVAQDISLYLDSTGSVSITASDIDNGSSDNCTAVNLSLDQTTFTSADVGSNSVALTVSDGSGNQSTRVATVTIIEQISQTITFDAISDVTYGDEDFSLNATGGDSGNPITFVSSDQSVAVVTGSVVSIVGVGSVTITASQAGTSVYANAEDVSRSFTVNAQALTVSAFAETKVYGDNDPTLSYTLTSGVLHDNDALSGSISRVGGEDVGTYEITQGTLNVPNANYSLTFVSNSLIITSRSITITANDKTKDLGDNDPELTYQITSGALQFSDSLSGSLTRESGEGVGTYDITQGTLDAGSNYTLTFVVGVLVIGTPECTESKPTELVAEEGTEIGIDTAWTYVSFTESFYEAVVVATPVLASNTNPPMVTRVRNVNTCGFELKVQSTGGDEPTDVTVHWLAVEEGTYTEAEDGVTMEARRVTSTITSNKNSWAQQTQTYNQSYTAPVVIGQVMTANDTDWSVFYATGNVRNDPPSATELSIGKHVGASGDYARADETLGFIVIESGSGYIGSNISFEAGITPDEVLGAENDAAGFSYSHNISQAVGGVTSIVGMDGADGAWAILYDVSSTDITLACDEDQEADTERLHTDEQVAYVVLGRANLNPVLTIDQGTLTGVDTSWTNVYFDESFVFPVVVATPVLPDTSIGPLVTRVRNVTATGFEVRVQAAGGAEPSNITVHWVAVEEGTYTVAEDGVALEARTITSTTTDNANSWSYTDVAYNQTYTNPVVLGQVMSFNDEDWSVFWSSGTAYVDPPESGNLSAGKHVGEDSNTTRAGEVIGVIVLEAGSGEINGLTFEAGIGTDIVEGVGSVGEGFEYSIEVPGAEVAILSSAGMDGGDGGWPVLFGGRPVLSYSLTLSYDEDQFGDSERYHTGEQVAYLVFGVDPGLVLEKGTVASVSSSWTSISYTEPFADPVVVATPVLPDSATNPIVTRVRNVTDAGFELRVQAAGGTTPSNITVHWVAVEQGVYTEAEHGITMEAKAVSSTVTASSSTGWGQREERSYSQTYANPVVLGQVMTYNDDEWSVFWSSDETRGSPASVTSFQAGKHVSGDPNTSRADETLALIVIESGSGSFNDLYYEAAVGSDIVFGSANTSEGYSYSHNLPQADVAVVSVAGFDGSDGGWPVLFGSGVSSSDIKVVFDEDIAGDAERYHTDEQVAYWIFADSSVAAKPTPVAVEETLLEPATEFVLYPNPTDSYFTLRVEGPISLSDLQVKLVDMSGRTWALEQEYAGSREVGMDVSNMPSGMYMLVINAGGEQITKKLVIK